MIKTVRGNILNASEGIIVHGCNSVGQMAGGLAAQVANRYPEALGVYVEQYYSRLTKAGKPYGLDLGSITFTAVEDRKFIVNAVTQLYPGSGTLSYAAIYQCFMAVRRMTEVVDLPILFPQIGAGIAGGNWDTIYEIIDTTVGDLDCTLYIYG